MPSEAEDFGGQWVVEREICDWAYRIGKSVVGGFYEI
jgi:uncharacterized protein YegJ (DUF2314 family)